MLGLGDSSAANWLVGLLPLVLFCRGRRLKLQGVQLSVGSFYLVTCNIRLPYFLVKECLPFAALMFHQYLSR